MAEDEAPTTLPVGDDTATAHDGDVEPGADPHDDETSASGDDAKALRDLLAQAESDIGAMVTALDADDTDGVDMDGLLDKAHAALTSLLSGEPCPMCQGDGVLAVEPPADPRAERCPDCQGRGKVYTGSLVPESAVRPCGKCAGAGFVERASVTTLPTVDYVVPPPPVGAQYYDADDPGTWHLPIDPALRGTKIG